MSSFPSADNYNVGEIYTAENGNSAIVGYTYDGGYGENSNQSGGASGKTRTVSYMRNGKRISYKVNAKTGRKVAGKKASPKRRSPKARKTWLPYDEGAVHDGVTSLGSKSQTDKKKLLKQAMTYFLMKRMGRESDELNVDDLLRRAEANDYSNTLDQDKSQRQKAQCDKLIGVLQNIKTNIPQSASTDYLRKLKNQSIRSISRSPCDSQTKERLTNEYETYYNRLFESNSK